MALTHRNSETAGTHAPQSAEVPRWPQYNEVIGFVEKGGQTIDTLTLLLWIILRYTHPIQKTETGVAHQFTHMLPEEEHQKPQDMPEDGPPNRQGDNLQQAEDPEENAEKKGGDCSCSAIEINHQWQVLHPPWRLPVMAEKIFVTLNFFGQLWSPTKSIGSRRLSPFCPETPHDVSHRHSSH